MLEKLLLAYDGSEPSKKALEFTKELAKKLNAKVTVLYVIDIEKVTELLGDMAVDSLEMMMEKARKVVSEAVEELKKAGIEAEPLIEKGGPPEKIAEVAEKGGYGMIIMGSHGYRGLKRLFLGSVSEKVLRIAKVPVTIVKYK